MALGAYPRTLSGGPATSVTTADIQSLGVNQITSTQGAGTNYTVTTTDAAVTFGTTSPSVTLPATGIYFLTATIQFNCTGATITTQNVLWKLRRTNNTPADLTNATTTFGLPTGTTLTRTVCILDRGVFYNGAAGDTIALFTNLSAALGAGTLSVVSSCTYITAWRLL